MQTRRKKEVDHIDPESVAKVWAMRNHDPEGFELVFIEQSIGYGVITTRPFKKGSFLMIYPGEKISVTEGNNRLATYPDYLGSYIFFRTGACFDATQSKQIGKFLNHSRKHFNAKPRLVDTKICIFATMDICKGMEVRYDYGVRNIDWKETDKPCTLFIEGNNLNNLTGKEDPKKTPFLTSSPSRFLDSIGASKRSKQSKIGLSKRVKQSTNEIKESNSSHSVQASGTIKPLNSSAPFNPNEIQSTKRKRKQQFSESNHETKKFRCLCGEAFKTKPMFQYHCRTECEASPESNTNQTMLSPECNQMSSPNSEDPEDTTETTPQEAQQVNVEEVVVVKKELSKSTIKDEPAKGTKKTDSTVGAEKTTSEASGIDFNLVSRSLNGVIEILEDSQDITKTTPQEAQQVKVEEVEVKEESSKSKTKDEPAKRVETNSTGVAKKTTTVIEQLLPDCESNEADRKEKLPDCSAPFDINDSAIQPDIEEMNFSQTEDEVSDSESESEFDDDVKDQNYEPSDESEECQSDEYESDEYSIQNINEKSKGSTKPSQAKVAPKLAIKQKERNTISDSYIFDGSNIEDGSNDQEIGSQNWRRSCRLAATIC
ncbi:uncharacterized protein [Clytia hemisphaerica]|uniref:uncharacterized protein n=1 Tax=Clytia hemisphaerica TaxID=252671 RepID=UPI0034D4E6CE